MAVETQLSFRELRLSAGLSVEEVAELFDFSIDRARELEFGTVKPQVRQIQVLKGLAAIARKRGEGQRDEPQHKFVYYDFFAGGGMAGIGLGSSWRCTFANDIDQVKASAYRAYHRDEAFVSRDVRQVQVSQLPDTADLAWASFPCQDLSLAGGGAETKYILGLMNPTNLAKVSAAKRLNRRVVGTIYRRTRPDGHGGKVQRAEVRFDNVAGCLRTPRGGSSRQTIMIVDSGRVRSRLLSPREAARLMGLPDEYQLPRRYNDAYHLAGDGVAIPVVRYLAQNIISQKLRRPLRLKSSGRAWRRFMLKSSRIVPRV